MTDISSLAREIHKSLYARTAARHAYAWPSYHPRAVFSDPLVTVRTKRDVIVQFDSFESVFRSVDVEIHGVAEVPGFKLPAYNDLGGPFDYNESNRYVVVDSTQWYYPNVPLTPPLPLRAWTVYQFTPFEVADDPELVGLVGEIEGHGNAMVKWLVTRHEDSWSLPETVVAIVPSSVRAVIHNVKGVWSYFFTRFLEAFVVGSRKGYGMAAGMDGIKH